MTKPDKDIPISRAVGRFFGHLWHAAAKPAAPDSTRKTVTERTEETPGEIQGQPVVFRRTTIEEIELRKPDGP